MSLLAGITDPIGRIIAPTNIPTAINASTGKLEGVIAFFNSGLKLVFIVAGLYAFVNVIVAGFGFMTAGGDPKNFQKAWDRIWQTLMGLFIIMVSFLLAAIIGILFFQSPTALLQPSLGTQSTP